MSWTNRITRQAEVAPDQLLANPWNWRVHPKAQQDALAAVLERVGWVQRVIVNETTGHVVDGHLRVALALQRDEPRIPVSYVALTEAEEQLALATFDAIAGLAGRDVDALRQVLDGIEAEGELAAALALLHPDGPVEPGPDENPDVSPPDEQGTLGVLVTFPDEAGQASGYDELTQMGYEVRVVNT